MLKKVLIAAALTICAAGTVSAQLSPTNTAGAVTVTPTNLTAIAACESQMHRLAGLNKGLAANYNAQRTHDACVANVTAGTDIASR
jgi:hypothetical protein